MGGEPGAGLRQLQLQRCAKPLAGDEALLPPVCGQFTGTDVSDGGRSIPGRHRGRRANRWPGKDARSTAAGGFKADLVLLDLADPAYMPFNSAVRQLVYADSGRSIETVIVNGRVLVRDRRLVSVDEAALREDLRSVMPTMRADFEGLRRAFENVRPYFDEV